jgi:hypothetical protein
MEKLSQIFGGCGEENSPCWIDTNCCQPMVCHRPDPNTFGGCRWRGASIG